MQYRFRKITIFINAKGILSPIHKRNHSLQYYPENSELLTNIGKQTAPSLDVFINLLNWGIGSVTSWLQNVYPLMFTKVLHKSLQINIFLFLGHINF